MGLDEQTADQANDKLINVSNTDNSPNQKLYEMTDKKVLKFKETKWRFLMLVFSSLFLVGNYYCYDNPGPLQTFIEKQCSIGQATSNLLYTVYSYPNIILPALGGLFLDKIGMR
jgi:hypothetical protein